MKRMIFALVVSLMSVSLVACGKNAENQTPQAVIPRQDTGTQKADDADESEQVNTQDLVQSDVSQSGDREEGQDSAQEDVQESAQDGSQEETQESSQDSAAKDEQASNGSRILIAYFTVPETDGLDTVSGASRVATEDGVVGNTEFVAKEIQKNLGGDLFQIETEQEYPGTHEPLLEFAYNEKSDGARPKLSTHIDNLDSYDYIFVGFPNWNADLPMPLYSFFDEYDFSGKTIIPFVTHGGSGFSNTISTIEELEPGATVVEAGLSVSRNSVANAEADIKNWTDSLISD